jgi:predicted MFS family arabinose efflux permease
MTARAERTPISVILGVPLGAWVGQYLGWRYTFYMVTLIGVLSALAVISRLRSTAGWRSTFSSSRIRLWADGCA